MLEVVLKYEVVPFHICCPSLKGKLDKGRCMNCNIYRPSEAAMKYHCKYHRLNQQLLRSSSDKEMLHICF